MAEATARTGVPSDQRDESTQLNPVAEALRVQQTFNREQVAWLMAQAQRWGYDAGYEDGQRDELALAAFAAQYADRGPFDGHVTAVAARKVAYRAACDRAARLPRPADFQGVGSLATELKAAA